jgi:signal transduction histidine kinase
MRRLYLRIYVAMLASLVVFAVAAGVLWRTLTEPGEGRELGVIARNVLAPADAPPAEQQAALERVARDVRMDLALFSSDGARLAAVGAPLTPPGRSGWRHSGGDPSWATRLPDGRWLASRPHHRRGPLFGLFALVMILLAVGVGAYPVVRRLTKRLERLQHGVEALGAGELSARVKVEGKDEVARLAESFNRAAARIEELLGAHKSLLANASHELRTPLARIRMALELGKDRHEIERDIAELDTLIDEILLASRLDATRSLETVEEVDLLALAAEEAARYELEVQGEHAVVKGDARLLRRAIRNLLENARRHGAPPIEVWVRKNEIRVCDAGAGVAPADRERIFEPFNSKRGTGLGLALVRQIARRHGGDARCEGNCFVIAL